MNCAGAVRRSNKVRFLVVLVFLMLMLVVVFFLMFLMLAVLVFFLTLVVLVFLMLMLMMVFFLMLVLAFLLMWMLVVFLPVLLDADSVLLDVVQGRHAASSSPDLIGSVAHRGARAFWPKTSSSDSHLACLGGGRKATGVVYKQHSVEAAATAAVAVAVAEAGGEKVVQVRHCLSLEVVSACLSPL